MAKNLSYTTVNISTFDREMFIDEWKSFVDDVNEKLADISTNALVEFEIIDENDALSIICQVNGFIPKSLEDK